VQGKLAAAYRKWDGGAEKLDPDLWQRPHWRSYFESGTISLELPLIDARGAPIADGRTAPNCEREIFIEESSLAHFLCEFQAAMVLPPSAPSSRPKRGPKAGVRQRVADAMRADLLSGRKTAVQLRQPEKTLAAEYGASRDTIRKARYEVLAVETVSKLSSANDK
jgi:hypothetical protein